MPEAWGVQHLRRSGLAGSADRYPQTYQNPPQCASVSHTPSPALPVARCRSARRCSSRTTPNEPPPRRAPLPRQRARARQPRRLDCWPEPTGVGAAVTTSYPQCERCRQMHAPARACRRADLEALFAAAAPALIKKRGRGTGLSKHGRRSC